MAFNFQKKLKLLKFTVRKVEFLQFYVICSKIHFTLLLINIICWSYNDKYINICISSRVAWISRLPLIYIKKRGLDLFFLKDLSDQLAPILKYFVGWYVGQATKDMNEKIYFNVLKGFAIFC